MHDLYVHIVEKRYFCMSNKILIMYKKHSTLVSNQTQGMIHGPADDCVLTLKLSQRRSFLH